MTTPSAPPASASASSSTAKIDPVTAVQDSIDALALSLFEALRGVRDAVATTSSSSSASAGGGPSSDQLIPMSAFQDVDDRTIQEDINNNISNSVDNNNSSDQLQQQQAREKLLEGLNMEYFPIRAYDMLHPDYESFILSYLGGMDGYAKELVERFHALSKSTDDDKATDDKMSGSSGIILDDRFAQQQKKSNDMQVTTTETLEKNVNEEQDSKKSQIGEVGYEFRKEFDSGWYTGKVVEIRPLAENGFDRRCVYSDGDIEDMRLEDLEQLAKLDPNYGSGSNTNNKTDINRAKKPRLSIKLNVSKTKPPLASTTGVEQSLSLSLNRDTANVYNNNATSAPLFPMSRAEYIKLLHDAEHHRDYETTSQLAANVLSKSIAVNDLVANLPGMDRTRSMQLARIEELIEENRRVQLELEEVYALASKRREENVRMALSECTALALSLDEE